MFGCKPNITNNTKTLDKVFSKEKIKIVIKSQGCFSYGNYKFTLKKENNDYKLCYKKWKLNVKSDSVKSFKQFLFNTFNSKPDGSCTNIDYVKVGNYFNSVDYKENSCPKYSFLRILPFYKLIDAEGEEKYGKLEIENKNKMKNTNKIQNTTE